MIKVYVGQIWIGSQSRNKLLRMRVAAIEKGKGDSREIQVQTLRTASGEIYNPPADPFTAVVEWLPRVAKPEKL